MPPFEKRSCPSSKQVPKSHSSAAIVANLTISSSFAIDIFLSSGVSASSISFNIFCKSSITYVRHLHCVNPYTCKVCV
ncbi:hypothetical protein ALC57_07692 [Trachymyrmex cornetzi]|uniref:Uncharacterized protein n=1 Tax=Trachymyrmex cornetzi TaxID=471704 RepID=A0A195E442_9HYME|nr:hypothetical protein ALC57_07692 [Trachymyrmex cornetzi]